MGHSPPWSLYSRSIPPEGPVLDVGCGSGDLAIHLAQSGLESLGIDFVEEAITQARSKKAALPSDANRLSFRVADALRPSLLGQTFGAVVDSGFYHLFDSYQCERFIDELALVLRPGGRCYLHEFAVTFPIPNVPRQVTEEELRGAVRGRARLAGFDDPDGRVPEQSCAGPGGARLHGAYGVSRRQCGLSPWPDHQAGEMKPTRWSSWVDLREEKERSMQLEDIYRPPQADLEPQAPAQALRLHPSFRPRL